MTRRSFVRHSNFEAIKLPRWQSVANSRIKSMGINAGKCAAQVAESSSTIYKDSSD
jgi:hypothetical protein